MRTWLFVPADDEAKVIKAIASSADVVILDLEVEPEPFCNGRRGGTKVGFVDSLRHVSS